MLNIRSIVDIQKKWGNAIVEIGKAYTDGSDYEQTARVALDKLYGFNEGKVLFKPTKAATVQFRNSLKSALSYFIGGNPDFAEDKGFALHPWTNVRFQNSGIIIKNSQAIAMGNYFFTDTDNKETKVEFTFGYFVTIEGDIKIHLHHSSIPFSG